MEYSRGTFLVILYRVDYDGIEMWNDITINNFEASNFVFKLIKMNHTLFLTL